MTIKKNKLVIPRFGSETEDARWHDRHKRQLETAMEQRIEDGRTLTGREAAARELGGGVCDFPKANQGDCEDLDGIDCWLDPRYYTTMSSRLTLDKAGRVVIPKPVREELHLEPGDSLEMESVGEQITLRPVRGTGPLTKEHGVWVFHAGQPLPACSTDEMLQQIREERDLTNLGNDQ